MDDVPRSVAVYARPSAGGGPVSDRWLNAVEKALQAAVVAGVVDNGRIAGEPEGAPAPDEIAFIIDPTALVLGSTFIRMLRALGNNGTAQAARQVPLDPDSQAQPGCLLLAPSTDADAAAATCPDAVIFLDQPQDARATEVAGCSDSVLEQALTGVGLARVRRGVAVALGPSESAFLSVVMRTQCDRLEALRDVLLCLAGQSDGRFELLLVVHDRELGQARDILNDQPDWLISRTRILTASGGTRSRPLNVGIEAARGTHIAFLDDDDLVFSHWVACFLEAADTNPRALLRAEVGVQWVTTQPWPDGTVGHASVSGIETPYPVAFDLADHLRVNMTPFMAFAFPRSFFELFGGADEALTVCEDWDLVLRAASILGVADLSRVTAIYRRWKSGSDSYSTHTSAVWARDMAVVRQKLDAGPIILPAGAATNLITLASLRGVDLELAAILRSTSWRITAPLRYVMVLAARVRHMVTRRSGYSPTTD